MEHRSGDTDMAEAEPANHQHNQSSSSAAEDAVVRDLITLARHFINQKKPSQALQAVLMAMRSKGGDEAVYESLHRARELYRSRLQANVAADQLASLFAECAIAEAQPTRTTATELALPNNVALPEKEGGSSILAESGRMQIVLDASADGSSFICLQCGGLVSNQRKDEHFAFWCCQI